MDAPQGLSASAREPSGKGGARAIRRAGRIPGIIYGGGEPPQAVSLPHKDVDLRIGAGGFFTTVFTLDVDGKPVRVIPRDYQLDPVKDFPLHVDFLRITAGSVLTVEIPVRFINGEQSPGIKRGGVLNIVRHAIEVTCPAEAIPAEFVCDLAGLDINDSIHISAVTLPEGVRPTIRDRDFTIATIASPAGLKEEAEEKAAAEAAAAAEAGAAAPGEAAAGAEGEAAKGAEAEKKSED
jgi:large subunit ribosomal protein L25